MARAVGHLRRQRARQGVVPIGSGVQRRQPDEDNKVFAATEIAVLARNPNIDPTARDVLAYYQRCLLQGQTNMNFGYIAD